MLINVADIQIDRMAYPRDSHDNESVSRYRMALDRLPPIKVNQDLVLIDGYHRLLAYQVEGKQQIPADILKVPRDQILVEAIRLNAAHGKQLSVAEKRRHARTLWEQRASGPSDTETRNWIADLLSVSIDSVYDATKELRKEQKEGQKRDAWNMWLACASQDTIGDTLGVTQRTIGNWVIENLGNYQDFLPDSLHLYDVWTFSSCDDRYGIAGYPGQIPGQIVENVLHYYTKPGDIILDPMAGGGTAIDVCKAMGRRFLAFDVQPIRNDIGEHDITTGSPPIPDTVAANGGIKLVFVDPPYWTMKDADYSAESVSTKTLAEFNEWITQLAHIAFDLLAPGGVLAFLIQNQTEKNVPAGLGYIDHVFEAYNRLLGVGFLPERRIACPQSAQTFGGKQVEKAKEEKHLMGLVRDLIILRKANAH